MAIILGVLTLLHGLPGGPAARAELDNQRIARATVLIEAVVLRVENEFDKPFYRSEPLGSGVIVSSDGLILTNSHVIDLTSVRSRIDNEAASLGAELEIQEYFQISVVEGISDAPTPSYRATTVVDRPEIDLAVLGITGNELGIPLSEPVGVDRPPVELSATGAPQPLEPVHIFGYPTFGSGEDPRFSTIDIINTAVRKLVGLGADVKRIEINAIVGPGNSGGAVVDDNGLLVGIVAQALSAESGGTVAAAIPVDRARAVLSAAGWTEPSPTAEPPTSTPTPPLTPTGVDAEKQAEDAERFANLLAARAGTSPLAGPFSGMIVQTIGASALQEGAGVTIADFSASVKLVNPAELSGKSWDLGFTFHSGGSTGGQFQYGNSAGIVSNGEWFFSDVSGAVIASGQVSGIDTAPGATNTLDLFVAGATGLLSVNGQFVTALDLPPPVAGDVFVGTAYFVDSAEPARGITYEDFRVWPLSASSFVTAAGTPAPLDTPVAASLTPPAAEGASLDTRFGDLLTARANTTALAGPFAGELTQDAVGVAVAGAGLTISDFSAAVTVVNPAVLSGRSWDFGFLFHRAADKAERIVVDSNGSWSYQMGQGGTAIIVASGWAGDFDATPGASNTIDLFVQGTSALLGVNGQFVAEITLSSPYPSDVQVGTAFSTIATEPGRAVAYTGFEVWPYPVLPGSTATSTPAVTPPDGIATNTPAVVTTPEIDPNATRRFAAMLRTTASSPDYGPFAGVLTEATPGEVQVQYAGVQLANFAAAVTFTNLPASGVVSDVGMEFRSNPATGVRTVILLDAQGYVSAFPAGEAPLPPVLATSYDPAPGAINTLHVFANGSEALVGVNDELVLTVPLRAAPQVSDIAIGAAYDGNHFLQDRVTPYESFRVWDFVPGALTASNASSAPTATLVPATLAETPVPSPPTAPPTSDGSAGVAMLGANAARDGVMPGPGLTGEPELLWTFNAGGLIESSAAVVDGVVYVGSWTNDLYALDAATGSELWRFNTGVSVESSPAVVDGLVSIGGKDGQFHALDAATGTAVWTYAADSKYFVYTSPAVADGVVYVQATDINTTVLFALDAATGQELWRHSDEGESECSPAVADGVVYASGGLNTYLTYALDAATGEELWTRPNSATYSCPLVVAEEMLFLIYGDGLHAWDAASGDQLWQFDIAEVISPPAVMNGMVYFGAFDNNLYALDAATGQERWRFTASDVFDSSPSVADAVVYIGNFDKNLYALDAATGAELWHFQTGGGIATTPAVVDGVVYVGSYDGTMYAIGG